MGVLVKAVYGGILVVRKLGRKLGFSLHLILQSKLDGRILMDDHMTLGLLDTSAYI